MLLDYYHHIRAPHVSFKPLPALYISFTLRTLAISLVSVFIPIFILEQTGDFAFVLLFWGLNAILVVLSAIPLGFVVSRLGLKWSVFVSAVLLAVEFYLFSVLGKYPGLLWVIPVFEAGKLLLFWIPYHLIFIENGSDKHSGEQVSIVCFCFCGAFGG